MLTLTCLKAVATQITHVRLTWPTSFCKVRLGLGFYCTYTVGIHWTTMHIYIAGNWFERAWTSGIPPVFLTGMTSIRTGFYVFKHRIHMVQQNLVNTTMMLFAYLRKSNHSNLSSFPANNINLITVGYHILFEDAPHQIITSGSKHPHPHLFNTYLP